MGAHVVRLQTKKARLDAAKAEELRQDILDRPGLPEPLVTGLLATIDRHTTAVTGWTFVMLSPADNAKVVSWLAANSSRPMVAMQLWATLFLHLRHDTGEIAATRDELAEAVGIKPDHVSGIMTELESINAISRNRVKVAGMRGPGVVRYRMNSHIGTHLTGAARDKAQAEDGPLLRLLDGGQVP